MNINVISDKNAYMYIENKCFHNHNIVIRAVLSIGQYLSRKVSSTQKCLTPTKSKKQLLCSDRCILMGVDFVGPKVSEPPISWPWGSSSHEPPKIHMQNGSFTHNCVIECISLCHKKCARLRLCPRSHWRSLQCFPKFPSQLGRLKALPHPRQTPLPSEPQSSCLQRSKWTSWCQCSYYQVS